MNTKPLLRSLPALALAAVSLCATPAFAGIVTIDFGNLPTTATSPAVSSFGTNGSYTEDGITVTKLSGSVCGFNQRSSNGRYAGVGVTCDSSASRDLVGKFQITAADLLTLNSLDLFSSGRVTYQFQGFLNGVSVWDTGLIPLAESAFKNFSGFSTTAADTIFMTFDARGAVAAGFDNINLTTSPRTSTVPEPGTLVLAGLALAGLAFARKRMPA